MKLFEESTTSRMAQIMAKHHIKNEGIFSSILVDPETNEVTYENKTYSQEEWERKFPGFFNR